MKEYYERMATDAIETLISAFTELISYSTLSYSDVETLQLVLEDMLENGVGMHYE